MKQSILLFFSLCIFTSNQTYAQSLESLVQQHLNTSADELNLSAQDVSEWTITDNHISTQSGVLHIYIRQQYQGIEIVDADADLHFTGSGKSSKALSIHNNFMKNSALNITNANATNSPALTAAQAVKSAADQLGYRPTESLEIIKQLDTKGNEVLINSGGISLADIPAKLVYQQDSRGQLKLAWDISILALDHINWWSIRIDAATGEVLDQNNWTISCDFGAPDECSENHEQDTHQHKLVLPKNQQANMVAGYNVYAVPVESPIHGNRTLVSDPADATASPYGWHDTNGAAGAEFTITRGNNVHAYEDNTDNPVNQYSPDGGASLTFDYPIDLTQEPINNEDANITNLFYWNNIIHDVAYHLGFDEASGNFQENNYERGGFGSDYVNAEAQDGGGTNNANFATPPDGSNPRMQMYLWSGTPQIDGDLDNGIILHEYGHGISIRLTGGASNSGCLNNQEQMGEGWSDYWGMMLTMKDTDQGPDRRGVGTYALNQATNGNGIRTYPYSTDMSINSHTYDDIKPISAPHGVGSVWCAMLWEMTWGLIDEHGFNADFYQETGGNHIAMQLVMEGLKLQPCSPGFVDGRDAILKADTALYAGANSCIIWRAFAKRGLGYSATQGSTASKTDGVEAFDLPPGVNENCTTDPDYAITISPSRRSACPGVDFVYNVSILAFNGYTGTVDLTTSSLPSGVNSALSASSFSTFPATATWTISNTSSLAAGEYAIQLDGTDGTIMHNKAATLEILSSAAAPALTAPANNANVASLKQTLQWSSVAGANNYDLQMATNADFSNLVINESGLSGTSFATALLTPNTTYYWRVRSNSCTVSSYNESSFTVSSACDQQFTDSGGASGPHQNNETIEWIFCPDNVGEAVSVTFSSFNVETRGATDCWDDLTVYNGNNTSAPLLGAFCGTTVADAPGGGVISATNATGCLTFVFDSDGSITRDGWVATISCLTCSEPVVTDITTTSENCAGANDGTITVTATSSAPINYELTPSDGSPIINTTGIFSELAANAYTLVLRAQNDADCVSAPTNITLESTTPTIAEINTINSSCTDKSDGAVTLTSSFNSSTEYVLIPNGETPIVNITGIFSGLPQGNYTASVRKVDDATCTSIDTAFRIDAATINAPSISNYEICITDTPPIGEGLTADCGVLCNRNTITPNSPINASNTTVCETITVNGNTQPVSEIYLSIVVEHTWVGDLSATLESPDGTVISLFDAPGIPGSTYGCSFNNLNLVFADTASLTATDLENTCNISSSTATFAISGAYQSIDLFSTLNGENANGEWKICLIDSYASADHGQIKSITLAVNPETSTTTWWDAPTDGNLLYTGAVFDPVANGAIDPIQSGRYPFWAQCECNGCPSQRTQSVYNMVDGNYYFLDDDADGYGDANNEAIICTGAAIPDNYVSNFTDCDDGNSGDVMIAINSSPVASGVHQANNTITSEGDITSTTLVTFLAGKSIRLQSGFHAQRGSNFLAKIDSCGQHPNSVLKEEPIESFAKNARLDVVAKINSEINLKIFPNPFKHSTQVTYQLTQREKINLAIYDSFGRLVKSFYQDQWQESGNYEITFEGNEFVTGIFTVVLQTNEEVIAKRIILAK